MPEAAAPYVAVMGTGRSDYPNQVNNLLAFPGLFRGALDVRARKISESGAIRAAPPRLGWAKSSEGHASSCPLAPRAPINRRTSQSLSLG